MVNMFSGSMLYGGQSGNVYANMADRYGAMPTPNYGPRFYNNTAMTIIPREPMRKVEGNIFKKIFKTIFL